MFNKILLYKIWHVGSSESFCCVTALFLKKLRFSPKLASWKRGADWVWTTRKNLCIIRKNLDEKSEKTPVEDSEEIKLSKLQVSRQIGGELGWSPAYQKVLVRGWWTQGPILGGGGCRDPWIERWHLYSTRRGTQGTQRAEVGHGGNKWGQREGRLGGQASGEKFSDQMAAVGKNKRSWPSEVKLAGTVIACDNTWRKGRTSWENTIGSKVWFLKCVWMEIGVTKGGMTYRFGLTS